ncbi:MAG: NAD-binding protein, partial [Pseudomonadota bacterium]|nr:NAD-binding protein [Pseudomonadota bacterium]
LPMRAESASLSTMVAGPSAAVAKARPLMEGYSANIFHVGETAGLGQRMKVVNNALYIASLVVISEGLAFGERGGLTLDDMLAVINTSSGQSFGTQNVFPQHIANGSFDGTGAEAHIIKKDLGLFVDGAAAEGSPGATIAEAYRAIAAFSDAEPTQDKARIYPFVRNELTPDIQA